MSAGVFHKIPRIGDSCLAEIFAREVPALREVAVVDRIIDHLKLRFVAAKPPPPHVFEQIALIAAEESGEYF